MNTTIRASVAAVVTAATLCTPSVAFAKGGGGAAVTDGACFGAVAYKLKADAKPANMVGAEFEVDANVAGQQWRVVLFHNGTRVMRDTFTTAGLSGSFTVRKRVPDAAGSDTFRARAVRLRDGQSCSGSVTF
jgi:hypothetical protein